jgi:hypothetical protein
MDRASNPSWPTFSRSRAKRPHAVREGVRVALADCEVIFRAQEANKRMSDKAAQACRALCPRASPRNYSDGGNADRRALETGAQHHRPAGARRALTEHRFPAALVGR